MAASSLPSGGKKGLRMEKCLFGKQELEVPEILLEDADIFKEVVNAQTWQDVVTDAQKRQLLTHLPKFPDNDAQEKQETLRQLFNGETFKFGNPRLQFHKKLKEGMFCPDIARYASLCRRAKMKEYFYQQRVYYSNLLKEVLINRQCILDQVYTLPPDEPLKLNHLRKKQLPFKDRTIDSRVRKKFRKIIKDVNVECGADDTSSEEEESHSSQKSKKQQPRVLPGNQSDEEKPSDVQGTLAPKPEAEPVNGEKTNTQTEPAPAKKRPVSPVDISDEDFQEMMRRHKKRRGLNEEHPELDTKNLTIEDIIIRTQLGKKTAKSTGLGVTKKKLKNEKKRKLKLKNSGDTAGGMASQPSAAAGAHGNIGLDENAPDGIDDPDIVPISDRSMIVKKNFGHYAHFFSLLRDLICEEPENRITTIKLEEKVREWSESASCSLSPWSVEQSNWVDLVLTSLKFLSGDLLGTALENFVPYIDYKERAQQWKWIGQGMDSDASLEPVCEHWLENKEELILEANTERSAPPPPPRVRTTYVIRPTTDEEKGVFREQEKQRFSSPHKAFGYQMHGYESVVGPVKGVYTKDNAMNKAREHALLVSDRPAYVTILTLVRDAAARLPNGEGTRADICELLKDSQFLAPGVTDAQINNVVSGALDRLHYEKDPCVKFDVNRKLWIYLHRNRSQDEFERIHQAQGAAAKAKKALQKPKPTKKPKDPNSLQATNPSTASTPTLTMTTSRPASVHSTSSNDSYVNVETLSPSPKGQTNVSPKGPVFSGPRVVSQQVSPKTISGGSLTKPLGQLQTSPHYGMKAGVQLPAAALVPGIKSVLTSLGQQMTHGANKSVVTQMMQHPSSRSLPFSLVPSSPQTTTPGSAKPMTFSLIHSQGGTKLVESLVQPAAKTMVLTTRPDSTLAKQKLISMQQQGHVTTAQPQSVLAALKSPKTIPGTLPEGAGIQMTTGITKPGSTRVVGRAVGGSLQTVTGAGLVSMAGSNPAAARLIQQLSGQLQSASAGVAVTAATAKSAGARMVHQVATGQLQTVTASGMVTTTKQTNVPASQQAATIKLHGGSFLQTMGGKPMASLMSAGGKPMASLVAGGKPMASLVAGGKPMASLVAGGKPMSSFVAGGNAMSAVTGGKPVTGLVAGGGKPVTGLAGARGKPVGALGTTGGKPLASLVTGGAKSVTLQRATSFDGLSSAVSTPTSVTTLTTAMAKAASQQLSLGKGGKPTTLLISKPGSPPTTLTQTHLVQSMGDKPGSFGGKPATLGGKPIIIGGKPAILSGKPIQFGGKPLQLISKTGQFAGLFQGQPAIVTAVSMVNQSGTLSSVPSSAGQGRTGGVQLTSASMVSQILQAASAQTQQNRNTATLKHQIKTSTPTVTTPTTSPSTPPQGGAKVITQTGGIVLTQFPQATSKAGVATGPQTRILSATQAGLLGTQIILQPTQTPSKMLSPRHLASGLRPTLLAAPGGKPAQNIQLLKTVLSQPGGKPGQTAILLAQPADQSAAVNTSSAEQLSQPTTAKSVAQTTAAQTGRGKTAPMYARIITPPPGVRLTPIRPGHVATPQTNQQGLSMLQAVSRMPGDTQAQVVMQTTMTPILTPDKVKDTKAQK